SGNEVVIRRMTLPEMSRADLLDALTLECRKHVNFPIEDSEIRYEVLGRSDRAGNPELLLSVCVAHRRRLDEVREAVEEAGLRPSLLTTRPVALRALVRATDAVPSGEVVAYLDMGGTNTHITVLKGNDIRFSREFGVGGVTLTEALRAIVVPGQGTIELSFDEAEALKRAHGIPIGQEEAGHSGRIPLSAEAIPQRVAAAAAALLLVSVALPAHMNVLSERSRIEGLKGTLAGLSTKSDAVRRFRAAREEETRLHDLLAHLTGGQVLWSYVLRDLSHRIGPDVRLTLLETIEPQAAPPPPGALASRPARMIRFSGLLGTQN